MSRAADEYARGNDAYEAGELAAAAAAYEDALRALTRDDDALAPDLHENLGLVLWKLGRWRAAARALMRTLDGDLTAREQALRVLVSCTFRDGRALDGERLLRLYEAKFGAHPEGWSRS